MSAKWQATNLGAICKFTAGSAFKPEYQGCSEGDYPFIKVSDMNAVGNEIFINVASNHVNEIQRAAMKAKLHPVGATVFAKIGVALTTNRRRLLTRPTIIDNNMMSATPRDGKVTSRFLYLLLTSLDFNTISAGTALPYLNVSDLERIEVSIPETLWQQEAIAQILGGIDDKIDLNRRINQTLEAMAQAIFKSWFVDFDPVKAKIAAKAEGRDPLRAAMTAISGKPDAELDTLPPDQFAPLAATAALFPDEMEDSALGEIPKGWHSSTLGEQCAYLNRGISPKYVDEGGVLVLNQKCIRDFSLDPSKGRRHDPNQRNVNGRELHLGDVLVNSTGVGTLGRVAQVLRLDEPTIVDSHVTVVRSGTSLNSAYLGQWFVTKQPDIEAMGEGSTGQTELSRGKLASMTILVPEQAVLGAFAAAVAPMQSLIATRGRESLVLQQTRDALLPRLLSGELQVLKAEAEATA
ncbi:MAG: restriction endonuclease subunit S [Hydrogenophaga sp.]